ncbi:MAG: site-specific DNA-methyltransferase [Candidatus Binataceae bacterium]|nr:site-specific DNA-methyltransferase [Candidatus Binataceae bacterium]
MSPYYQTKRGQVVLGDSLAYMAGLKARSIDLIVTSPPFGLVRKKDYGNVESHEYVEWFKSFGNEFKRLLKASGSLVIDIGGAWIPGQPTRSLYHFELAIMLCREMGFYLAQEFFWWNPSKLPSPAEWVTVRRIRVKDAVNIVWWLSITPWPKASNRRVLAPYSAAMKGLLKNGYRAKLRPSGHDISKNFSNDNGAAIPPNLIAIPNTESNSYYLRYCERHGLKPHPARFPASLPEFFVRMLTDDGDTVLDPFAGSCVVGEVCERLHRRWTCVEMREDYLKGALGRFERAPEPKQEQMFDASGESSAYKLHHPAALWNGHEDPLEKDGGKERKLNARRRS